MTWDPSVIVTFKKHPSVWASFHSTNNLSVLSSRIKTDRMQLKHYVFFFSTWPLGTILKFRWEEAWVRVYYEGCPPKQLTPCMFLFSFCFFFCKHLTQIVSGFCPGMFLSSLYWWQHSGYLGAGAMAFGSCIQICWAPFIARHTAGMTR